MILASYNNAISVVASCMALSMAIRKNNGVIRVFKNSLIGGGNQQDIHRNTSFKMLNLSMEQDTNILSKRLVMLHKRLHHLYVPSEQQWCYKAQSEASNQQQSRSQQLGQKEGGRKSVHHCSVGGRRSGHYWTVTAQIQMAQGDNASFWWTTEASLHFQSAWQVRLVALSLTWVKKPFDLLAGDLLAQYLKRHLNERPSSDLNFISWSVNHSSWAWETCAVAI